MADVNVTVTDEPLVDANGNIQVNGQSGISLIVVFNDDSGNPRDVSQINHYFRVYKKLNILMTPVAGQTSQKQLIVNQEDITLIGVNSAGINFVVVEQGTPDQVMWEGLVFVRGFTLIPTITT